MSKNWHVIGFSQSVVFGKKINFISLTLPISLWKDLEKKCQMSKISINLISQLSNLTS